MSERSVLDAPTGGTFTRPARAPSWRDLPQPIPVEERVWPPRRPDAPAAPVQDTAPVPPAWQTWVARLPSRASLAATARSSVATAAERRRGPRRKSVLVAAMLGLVLGPVGLFYVGWRHVVAAVLTGVTVLTLTLAVGLVVAGPETALTAGVVEALLTGPACAAWGSAAAAWRNRRVPRPA